MGHREFQRCDALPLIAFSYSDLEPKAAHSAFMVLVDEADPRGRVPRQSWSPLPGLWRHRESR
ncbi:MAG: hypothetical protein DI587_03280 [Variovorax paradoxus]|nr:MAG: hypothetical protein DI583_03280 [Variovorax paradoxus]PZQ15721.1 MAG: hypothetical protein DI587_03280 [Variovorax paradoxus]